MNMKTRNYILHALSVTALMMLLSACGNDVIEKEDASRTLRIPYSVQVRQQGSESRTTVDDSNNQLFETGDQLEVTGTDISGTLTLTSGAGSDDATFEGDLTFTGSGSPADDLVLTATLKSTANALTGNDYSAAVVPTLAEAVQKYSSLSGTSTFADKSFNLSQGSAFVLFEILFGDGSTEDNNYPATISDQGSTPYHASGTVTVASGKTHFVVAFPGGTELTKAVVTINEKVFKFGAASQTLVAGNTYTVKKILESAPINLSEVTGDVTIPAGAVVTVTGTKNNAMITVGAGATVTLDDAHAKQMALQGDATIITKNTNGIVNGSNFGNALTLTADSKVTFKGDGSLDISAQGERGGVAITGSADVVIESGNLTVSKIYWNNEAINVKSLTVTGGSLKATGGDRFNNSTWDNYQAKGIITFGNIMISGGSVEAKGSYAVYAGGNLTISGGTVIANSLPDDRAGSVGCGLWAAGNLNITGGTVTAKGSSNYYNQGNSAIGCDGNILICGGTVTATGGGGSAAIGTGCLASHKCGDISITSGVISVTATKGANATECIGLGNADSTVGTVTIETGANVTQN